jgi:hypothetical protein
MNWKLDPNDPYAWQVEGTPFGVDNVDLDTYAPFRLWNNRRVYVGEYTDKGRKDLTFRSRREAMDYVEKAVKEYQANIITAVEA